MQYRSEYLEALGIPDFLYSKADLKKESETQLKYLIIELSADDSFCKDGPSKDLLFKMLSSIDMDINNIHLFLLNEDKLAEFLKSNPAEVVLVMDSSYKSTNSSIFSMHHPRDILINPNLRRESWEVLKKVKQCLK